MNIKELKALVKRLPESYSSFELLRDLDSVNITDPLILGVKDIDPDNAKVCAVVAQSWLGIIRTSGFDVEKQFKFHLIKEGLFSLIKAGKASYEEFKSGKAITHPFFKEVMFYGLQSSTFLPIATTILCYPSRMTLAGTTKSMDKECLLEFRTLQQHVKLSDTYYFYVFDCGDRAFMPKFIEDHPSFTRYFLTDFYAYCEENCPQNWCSKAFTFMLKYLSSNPLPIPTGACSDAKTRDKKVRLIAEANELLNSYGRLNANRLLAFLNNYNFHAELSYALAVPKNVEKSRLICEYPTLAQSLGSIVQKYFLKVLDTYTFRNNVKVVQQAQMKSRELAQIGSINGAYATIDLSHASDSVSLEKVMHAICKNDPEQELILDTIVPRYNYSKGMKAIKLNTYAGAGYANTFNIECIMFALICSYGIEIAKRNSTDNSSLPTLIVGDDIVCPAIYADTIVDTLTNLGFEVNITKSFISGPFREACGGDYYNGIDITPIYFPRKRWSFENGMLALGDISQDNVNEFNTTLISAIKLARRLYQYPFAQTAILDFILANSKERFTISNDIEEEGVRSKFYEKKCYLRTPYLLRDLEEVKVDWRLEEERRYFSPKIPIIHCSQETMDNPCIGKFALDIYLSQGPQYEDELSKLLGVSTQRVL